MTGDIKKGLMAGLGAYGGAGMAIGLAASGTQAAAVNPSVTPHGISCACCSLHRPQL
jgi:F0F1-type ATP synthase membrane subunit c/vacuolar-type H+-ATPase subunit K